MAVGDLIVAPYQYEFRGLLIGSGTPYLTEQVSGLLSTPGVKSQDFDRLDGHGEHASPMLLAPRIIEAEGRILGLPGVDAETLRLALADAFLPVQDLHPFVWQRPGSVKKFCNVRVNKQDVPSEYATARGHGRFTVQLKAVDPRVFGLDLKTSTVPITGTGISATNANVVNNGNWPDTPVFEIPGPAVNPRIKHNGQDRTIRIDMTIPNGQTLVVDVFKRTVMIGNTDHYDKVRNDNQWWVLEPGANNITYTRNSGSASGSTLSIRHRDVWMSG
jgi:hypothetical protein